MSEIPGARGTPMPRTDTGPDADVGPDIGGAGSVRVVASASTTCPPRRFAVMKVSSAETTYCIDANLSAGDFAIAFVIVASTSDGKSATRLDGGAGTSLKIASKSEIPLSSFQG